MSPSSRHDHDPNGDPDQGIDGAGNAAFGLFAPADFRLARGSDAGKGPSHQALWYFRDEWIAVPTGAVPIAAYTPGSEPFADVSAWSAAHEAQPPLEAPPLVWVAAPERVTGAVIDATGNMVTMAGVARTLEFVPRIALNRSWWDASSARWFAGRPLALRTSVRTDNCIVRTLWPEDFRCGPSAPAPRPLPVAPTPAAAMRALMREAPRGGARAPFAAATLWQRDTEGRDWTGKTVLAFIVNGAQGDDDEAHAGHFAIVTGTVRGDGAIGEWLVNNFYTLDSESEKGIIPAAVPLDNYLGDLNAGQAWYRPSCLLVAVLDAPAAAVRVQSALGRVYRQFYRQQLGYYHPTDNCTSISVDTLRALGLPVPARGPTSRAQAWLGLPWLLLRERSLVKAKSAFDYLVTDRTRLLPALALEDVFALLWSLAHGGPAAGVLARELRAALRALAWLRVPQFPSSRAFGDAPAVSLAEYHARVPRDPALRQIVPVPPRALPEELRDDDLLPRPLHPSDVALRVWAATVLALVVVAIAVLLA